MVKFREGSNEKEDELVLYLRGNKDKCVMQDKLGNVAGKHPNPGDKTGCFPAMIA